MPSSRLAVFLSVLLWSSSPVPAQERPVPSKCVAIAEALPHVAYAAYMPVQALGEGPVRITYAGHSTYVIETPAGVRIATDFSGVFGGDPLPHVVTMNKAHRTHFTEDPDARIQHVLRGWDPGGGPARHALVVNDVYIRNVPTDIRGWEGGLERDGNSIFIFEVADLCIGHLGHLHTALSDQQYAAIGRLDILMVPIDGGMTQSLGSMTEITTRLYSSMILPMHRHATPMQEFLGMMGEGFAVDYRDTRSLEVTLETLPDRPTIVILDGV